MAEQGFGSMEPQKPKVEKEVKIEDLQRKFDNRPILDQEDFTEEMTQWNTAKDIISQIDEKIERIPVESIPGVSLQEILELKENLYSKAQKFLKKDWIFIYGDHDHLNYHDEKFWGHYVSPKEEGLNVSVYQKEMIKGDPMDASGERGEMYNLTIELSEEEKYQMYKKIENQIKEIKKDRLNKNIIDSFYTADKLEDIGLEYGGSYFNVDNTELNIDDFKFWDIEDASDYTRDYINENKKIIDEVKEYIYENLKDMDDSEILGALEGLRNKLPGVVWFDGPSSHTPHPHDQYVVKFGEVFYKTIDRVALAEDLERDGNPEQHQPAYARAEHENVIYIKV